MKLRFNYPPEGFEGVCTPDEPFEALSGFQVSQRIDLIRNGTLVERVHAEQATWVGDESGQERLKGPLQVGDIVMIITARYGNGAWESETRYLVVADSAEASTIDSRYFTL